MKRLARTRSDSLASQPAPGRAQWSVGSIDDDGMRYGLTTNHLIRSTIRIAPAIVTIQSIAIRHGRGRPAVRRSSGLREWRLRSASACAGEGSGGGAGGGGAYVGSAATPATSAA